LEETKTVINNNAKKDSKKFEKQVKNFYKNSNIRKRKRKISFLSMEEKNVSLEPII